MEIPVYQQQVTPQASNVGVAIPTPHTELWDNFSKWSADLVDKGEQNLGAKAGIEAQQSNPDQNTVAKEGILDPILKLTSYGKGFDNGANQQYQVTKLTQLQDLASSIQSKYPNDPQGFNSAFAEAAKGWLKGVPDDRIMQYAGLADQMQTQTSGQINQAAMIQRRQQSAADLTKTGDDLRTQISDGILNGTLNTQQIVERQDQLNTLLQGGVRQGFISPLEAKSYTDKVGFEARSAEILKAFRANPSLSTIDAIKNAKDNETGLAGAPLTPEQRQQLGATLTGEYNQLQHQALMGQALAAQQVKTQVNDNLLSIAQTGKPVSGLEDPVKTAAALFPKNPAAQQEYQNKVALAFKSFEFTGQIGLSSIQDDAKALDQFLPKPGAPGYADSMATYQHMKSIVAAKWNTILGSNDSPGDPAQYVLQQSPQIRDMISAQPADPNDASQVQAAAATRSLGFQAVREIQDRMGIPVGRQSIIPNSQAQGLVQDIHALAAQPEQVANKMLALQSQYGDQFPVVMRQLARQQNPLAPSYQVLANMDRPQDAQTRVDFARALSLGDKALIDNLDKKDKTLKTTIDQSVQTALTDFSRTALAQASPGLEKSVNDAATSLAYYYGAVPGTGASAAAKSAVQAIIGKYDFTGTMRVPKGMAYQAEQATPAAQAAIKPDDLQPIPARPGEILTPDQIRAEQMRQVAQGHWVTTPDEDGVMLLYPNNQPVMIRNTGIPAQDQGAGVPVPDDRVQAKALQKKQNLGPATPGAEAKAETAVDAVVSKQQPWKPVTVKFKDMRALPLAPSVPSIPPEALQ